MSKAKDVEKFLLATCVLSFEKYLLSLVAHLLIGWFVYLAWTFWVLYILSVTHQVNGWQRFPPLCGLPLHSAAISTDVQKLFNWINPTCQPLLFSFSYGSPILEAIAYVCILKVLARCSSRSFQLRVLNSYGFKMKFGQSERWDLNFSHLLVDVPFSQHHLVKTWHFPSYLYFSIFVQICFCSCVSWFLVISSVSLFYRSICVPIPCCFITMVL